MNPVLLATKAKIAREGLTLGQAATNIQITRASLQRHLAGEYVRSDSLAKYRRWNSGEQRHRSIPEPPSSASLVTPTNGHAHVRLLEHWAPPSRPHYVVDLFSGCGGLSLGFELVAGGGAFETVLALDIEEPMVRCFNDNFLPRRASNERVGRQADLADFINEAEVLAFYLDHLASFTGDNDLRRDLDRLPSGSISQLKRSMAQVDRAFVAQLGVIRNSPPFRVAYASLESNAMGQTSVAGFQQALGLPSLSSTVATIPPLIWADSTASTQSQTKFPTPNPRIRKALLATWRREVAELVKKAKRSGPGQLASSAPKISSFVKFLKHPVIGLVKAEWLKWRVARDSLRMHAFGKKQALVALRKLYTPERQASVILGGPPCQGFSLIGRGKVRSLREHGVHVQADDAVGDERNRLLFKYTLFVGALRPKLFLFENVTHFQAQVRTSEGTFQATEVLAEAIRSISEGGADYSVAMATVDCSEHLVPQKRERFVMSGVRSDVEAKTGRGGLAEWLITLPVHPAVPLRTALEGLPEPLVSGVRGNGGADAPVAPDIKLQSAGGPRGYVDWVRQPPPRSVPSLKPKPVVADAHSIRAPRRDDAAWFRLMGPGTRWMDYRCDASPTLKELADVLGTVLLLAKEARAMPDGGPLAKRLRAFDLQALKRLKESADGSLSLRLLLESIEPLSGELSHHLLAGQYLAKRSGHHGDWLSRMDPEKASKTIVSHMAKDTYMYVHPFASRTLSVREAARIQTFPDWFRFGSLGLVDAFRVVGNAVPPLLSHGFAQRAGELLAASTADNRTGGTTRDRTGT